MFKKTQQFEDLEENTVQEELYFNFTQLEVIELLEIDKFEENLQRLGIDAKTKELTEVENTREAYDIFRDLILRAYGKKRPDGRGFDKKDPVDGHLYRNDLEGSFAFDALIIEFLQNPTLGAEFVEKCLPPKLVAAAKAEMAKNPTDNEITEMVHEADRRQQDPATRIEPGSLPAGVDKETLEAQDVPQELRVVAEKPKKFEDFTHEELLNMSKDEFDALLPAHPKDMTKQMLQIGMQRKSQ